MSREYLVKGLDNVSDVKIGIEEVPLFNDKIEEIFDNYFVEIQKCIKSDIDQNDAINDFLYMIQNEDIPKSSKPRISNKYLDQIKDALHIIF